MNEQLHVYEAKLQILQRSRLVGLSGVGEREAEQQRAYWDDRTTQLKDDIAKLQLDCFASETARFQEKLIVET